MFDGNLGIWYGKPYDIKLKPDAEPYHEKPFPVPCIHELTFKQELDQLKYLKVIKKVNRSQWGAPTFLIPKIQYLLLRLEGFRYGTTLDLNMGYYHIELSAKSK